MLTVLIADDEPYVVDLVRVTLEDDRLRVVDASDGEQALVVAHAERPEIVLLDVHMPRLTGLEVCRRLRAERAFATTTIIMLTAAAQSDDVARGLAAGADHYLTKPFSPIALLTLLERLMPEVTLWMPES
ncbi:MAG: response regulator [Candidatus Rokubacteria bacterium]|nr:response regulator [Candidatus Rokubacteria bacterium]